MSELDAGADVNATWVRHMRRGDFEAAWRVSDSYRRNITPAQQQRLPRWFRTVWNGAPLHGQRVLVRCHHGLGDTIQFIRLAALLRNVARAVIVCAQAELLPLLRYVAGIDVLLPMTDDEPEFDYDVDIEVMELPYALRIALSEIPAENRYIHLPAPRRGESFPRRVGIVWSINGDWSPERSLHSSMLFPLSRVPGVVLHVLQRGAPLADRDRSWGVESGVDDLLATARIMQTLDLIVSIDSMPAHLAGALGLPVWTLLRAHADWRWLESGESCPWYPTMRLFRQHDEGDWQPVIARVAFELSKL